MDGERPENCGVCGAAYVQKTSKSANNYDRDYMGCPNNCRGPGSFGYWVDGEPTNRAPPPQFAPAPRAYAPKTPYYSQPNFMPPGAPQKRQKTGELNDEVAKRMEETMRNLAATVEQQCNAMNEKCTGILHKLTVLENRIGGVHTNY